jgi:hypothetical protein
MVNRVRMPLVCLVSLLFASVVVAQETKPPEWKHGLEFKVRKGDEKEFTDKTRSFGTEAFLDRNNGVLVYVTETGALGTLAGGNFTPGAKVLPPKWTHGLELGVRKAGEAEFGKNTKKFGVEVFRDENAGTLVYVSETGSVAVLRAGNAGAASTKGPKWQHGLELRVRKGGEKDFTEKTQRFGVEAFLDENNGNLIYISETGALAVVPSTMAASGGETKGPKWTHGLEFKVRKAGEADFTQGTTRRSVEVFRDDNTGHLIYVGETGDLAVVPLAGYTGVGTADTKAPRWLHGLEFKVRKAGENEFTPTTKKWGVEVFRDENTGNTVYIAESGALGVLPK